MGEGPRVGVLVPNPFVKVAVEQAIGAVGAARVSLSDPRSATRQALRILLADVAAIGVADIPALLASGCAVVVFGGRGSDAMLAAARRAGAVALPRRLFLERLPQILASALSS